MFIPLYDGKPLVHISRSWVNWSLIAANILVFFVIQQPEGVNKIAFSFGLIPAVVNDIATLPTGVRVIPDDATFLTYAFLHGSVLHLAGNMIFLWVFGDNIEDAMGHLKYLIFYMLCAVVAGYAHSLIFATTKVPLVGASGAVAGVIAAYLILHPKMRVWILAFGKIPLPISAFWCLGAWVLWQFFQFATNPGSQVSWIAHIGGIIAGAILIVFMRYPHVALFDRDMK